MNFSDMLKKKNNNQEDPHNTLEPQADSLKEIAEELEHASEAQLNYKNDEEQIDIAALEEKHKAEIAELNDKYVRLFAEFDNYKRRTSRERVELLQTAGKDVIVSLLPVLDDFERALKSMHNATDVVPVKEGVELVHNKLRSILVQKGLKEMESKGNVFDSEIHEAITKIPSPSEDLKGKIIDEVEKGYHLNEKVIRFAKVVVGE